MDIQDGGKVVHHNTQEVDQRDNLIEEDMNFGERKPKGGIILWTTMDKNMVSNWQEICPAHPTQMSIMLVIGSVEWKMEQRIIEDPTQEML